MYMWLQGSRGWANERLKEAALALGNQQESPRAARTAPKHSPISHRSDQSASSAESRKDAQLRMIQETVEAEAEYRRSLMMQPANEANQQQPPLMEQQQQPPQRVRFEQLDLNSDGVIDRAEFHQGQQRLSLAMREQAMLELEKSQEAEKHRLALLDSVSQFHIPAAQAHRTTQLQIIQQTLTAEADLRRAHEALISDPTHTDEARRASEAHAIQQTVTREAIQRQMQTQPDADTAILNQTGMRQRELDVMNFFQKHMNPGGKQSTIDRYKEMSSMASAAPNTQHSAGLHYQPLGQVMNTLKRMKPGQVTNPLATHEL